MRRRVVGGKGNIWRQLVDNQRPPSQNTIKSTRYLAPLLKFAAFFQTFNWFLSGGSLKPTPTHTIRVSTRDLSPNSRFLKDQPVSSEKRIRTGTLDIEQTAVSIVSTQTKSKIIFAHRKKPKNSKKIFSRDEHWSKIVGAADALGDKSKL